MQQKSCLKGQAVVATRRSGRPHAARKAPVIRAYVVEKDQPPQQTSGGAPETVRMGINGEQQRGFVLSSRPFWVGSAECDCC
jgi:hypothetical protein